MDQTERMRRHQLISKAFRPAAPVDNQSLFAGRVKQMVTLLDHDFSGNGPRGRILDRLGTSYRFRYRFRDPLLQPYVLMQGQLDEMLPIESPGPSELGQPS